MNLWKEPEWSEMLFSYLTAGWYDWTVSEHLYKNNTHCWSVTSGYYSHYILATALLQLYRLEDGTRPRQMKRIATSHAALCSFLKGEIEPKLRTDFIDYLQASSQQKHEKLSDKLEEIGHALFSAKKARESHTYQVLVVSHQTLGDVTNKFGDNTINVSDTVEKISGYILELSSVINDFVINFVFDVITNLDEPIKHYHLKHFLEEIGDFYALVEKENVMPIPTALAHSIHSINSRVFEVLREEKCPRYRDFKQNISSFSEKWYSYNELKKNLIQLERAISILDTK
ncbi:hypothetical protein [Neobacillus niacini]|uniref:hypothetical protein n=1 Tax=Neobacillus niacini TaxID=86668 RepID=UPI0021CB1D37|nr:hypothetical protein [Neobacillus niacini]MCM3767741.1 hypothetical protein [Neobacillus niacini]